MIEAVMFWNEPNNKSHWDFEIDPDWTMFASMVKLASAGVRAENSRLLQVLGGISPIDPHFIRNMGSKGVLDSLDVVALHGFPLDWNHWTIHEWPDKIQEIREVTDLPIWISEVGTSTFGASIFGVSRLTLTSRSPSRPLAKKITPKANRAAIRIPAINPAPTPPESRVT